MTEDNNEIPRSTQLMDPNEFMELHKFFEGNQWLNRRYQAFFDLWNRCDNNEQRALVKELLENFSLVDSEKLDLATEEIADKIINDWKISSSNSRISAITDDNRADGSQLVLQILKNKFADVDNFDEHHFVDNLKTAKEEIRNGYSLVLVDDFVGTGNTVKRKLDWLHQHSKPIQNGKVNIYLVFVGAMSFSKEYLESLGYPLFAQYWLSKGISEIATDNDVVEKINQMKTLEKKLKKKHDGIFLPSLGYKKSESLFCLDGCNVPNNVFPIFWWPRLSDDKKRPVIFRRIR